MWTKALQRWNTLTVICAGYCAVIELVNIWVRTSDTAHALYAACTAAALTTILAITAAPLVLLALRLPPRFHPAAITSGSLIVAWFVLQPFAFNATKAYVMIAIGAAGLALVQTLLTQRRSRWRYALAVATVLSATVANLYIHPVHYRELHAACLLVACIACLPVVTTRFLTGRVFQLCAAVLCVASAGFAFMSAAPQISDRGHSIVYRPLLSLVHSIYDFDGDGYSFAAWGGDCDDFDSDRNPGQHERLDGHDRNCNGLALRAPRDSDYGLYPHTPSGYRATTVLLITVDTLRRDAVSPTTTPHYWRFRRKSLTFSQFYAAAPNTRWSIGAIATPALQRRALFGHLERAGIETSLLGFPPQFGLPGFPAKRIPSAATNTDRVITRLQSAPTTPQFIWLHYMEPHKPFTSAPISPSVGLAHIDKRYLGDVALWDRRVGKLLEVARTGPSAETTLIIVAADHGEFFGEHDLWNHGVSVFDEVLHVDASLWHKGISPGDYPHLVSHHDIPTTIAAALGAKLPSPQAGTTLTALTSTSPAVRLFAPVVSSQSVSGAIGLERIHAVVTPTSKLSRALNTNTIESHLRPSDRRTDRIDTDTLRLLRGAEDVGLFRYADRR